MNPSDNGSYQAFIHKKSQLGMDAGFEPLWMPDFLFDFQRALVEWAIRKGRAALFADTGMGKTPMGLVYAENIVRKENKPVLILTPLAVSIQTVEEGEKFGIEVNRTQDGTIKPGINVTNYERLRHFSPNDVIGVIADESSIIKHFGNATQKHLTRFMSKLPYRLLCTATAAPNDFYELGTSAEALGMMGYSDMLSRFFNQQDSKRTRMNDVKAARAARGGNYFARLAYRASQQISQWQLKPHAEIPFWRWVCSWARACRTPADLGFDPQGFILPPLTENHHIIRPKRPPDGMLFTIPAFGLREERDERRRTLEERCELAARLVDHPGPALVWCHLNIEGDHLEQIIPHAVQVAGRHDDGYKEMAVRWFLGKQCICANPMFRRHIARWQEQAPSPGGCGCGHATGTRRLISKQRIFGWGLNLQLCNHVVTFASHSYEAHYQSIRRCWRFGQTRPVTVDVISTEGEKHVRDNMARKALAADKMFGGLIKHMNEAIKIQRHIKGGQSPEVPSWL